MIMHLQSLWGVIISWQGDHSRYSKPRRTVYMNPVQIQRPFSEGTVGKGKREVYWNKPRTLKVYNSGPVSVGSIMVTVTTRVSVKKRHVSVNTLRCVELSTIKAIPIYV